jgi:L-ribulokinase
MMPHRFSLGVDYGTNAVRALILDVDSGEPVASASHNYQHGDAGVLCDSKDPNVARQSPRDYVDGFFASVSAAVSQARRSAEFAPDRVIGIGVDTTGSTPLPVDQHGTPLAFQEEFKDDLAAQAWLWKDHSSHAEAQEITDAARQLGRPYLSQCGGAYSSEWYWSKILHCLRTSPRVAAAAASWVELADFIPAFITGHQDPATMTRGICSAGHKAMYSDAWGGLPSAEFLDAIEPGLSRFRFKTQAVPSNQLAGRLSADAAQRAGLPTGIPVAAGALDAHMGAVGSGVAPGTLVKILGTSSCDCMVAPLDDPLPSIPGLCGVVPESILPGMYGLEAGQPAVGDIFNWFVKNLAPPQFDHGADVHAQLTAQAQRLRPGQSGLIALDWNNGNRSILSDPLLTGALIGQTLHTTAADIYRALIESSAFGALTIMDHLERHGVKIDQVITCGGIAEKNPFVMQIYADVCHRPFKVSRSAESTALGAAIFGAVCGGAYESAQEAQSRMTGVKATCFKPSEENARVYKRLYTVYRQLHDAFAGVGSHAPLSSIMKELIAVRNEVCSN